MTSYLIRITNNRGECLYSDYQDFSSYEKAEHFAQSIANAQDRTQGRCDWLVSAC